jgi:carbamoyl-phosphate synthase large subunit
MKALVTGAGALLGQGIITSLRRSRLDVEIVAVDPSPLSPGLFWADRAYRVPLARDAGYLDRLREVLESERPDIVFVGTDAELPLFAANRETLEREHATRVVVSDSRVVAIADDKYLTYEFLRDAGFDPPLTALPADRDELIESVGFPLVVKPRVGARSVGVRVVADERQLRCALDAAGDDGVVIQENIGTPDDEYTAGTLCFDGQPTVSIVMRRDLRDGNTYRAYTEAFPALNEHVVRVAEALRPFGPANFQFRTDREGIPRIFEINARFSGTTPLRALAGFAEVEMCARHLLHGEPIVQPRVREITVLRHWSELVVNEADIQRIG